MEKLSSCLEEGVLLLGLPIFWRRIGQISENAVRVRAAKPPRLDCRQGRPHLELEMTGWSYYFGYQG